MHNSVSIILNLVGALIYGRINGRDKDSEEEQMKLKFIKVKITQDDYGSYGIEGDLDGNSFQYPGITSRREEIERLARLINHGEVSIHHIYDVIEDFLG